jgi:hypothetical protein
MDLGSWWSAFTGWYMWQWPGWAALVAIGTVGSFVVLIRQTRTIARQLQSEIRAREQAQEREQVALQRAHTPYLSVEGNVVSIGQDVYVTAKMHADGDGVVHNVISAVSRVTPTGIDLINSPDAIRYLRGGSEASVQFVIPISYASLLPLDVRMDVSFINQFDQQVSFVQSGRIDKSHFKTLDNPRYRWPWDGPDPTKVKRSLIGWLRDRKGSTSPDDHRSSEIR